MSNEEREREKDNACYGRITFSTTKHHRTSAGYTQTSFINTTDTHTHTRLSSNNVFLVQLTLQLPNETSFRSSLRVSYFFSQDTVRTQDIDF